MNAYNMHRGGGGGLQPAFLREGEEAFGMSPLHFVAWRGDAAAIASLVQQGADVSAANAFRITPAHFAAISGQVCALEMLLSVGSEASLHDFDGQSVLDFALIHDRTACVRVLLRHGVRLETVSDSVARKIQPWMWALQQGRANCVAAVVALLGVKRRRSPALRRWDRFLVREVAFALFATRADSAWEDECQ